MNQYETKIDWSKMRSGRKMPWSKDVSPDSFGLIRVCDFVQTFWDGHSEEWCLVRGTKRDAKRMAEHFATISGANISVALSSASGRLHVIHCVIR